MSKAEHFLWDGNNLISRQRVFHDGNTVRTQWVYEPDSFRPLAQLTTASHGQQHLYYIVTDHSGTPRALYDEDGDIQWQGEQRLWDRYQDSGARYHPLTYQEDPLYEPIRCDLRNQGQIEDKESGLYYNYHRYYDVELGQYISPDPIGLAGGIRPQAYVHNPMAWVDPLGLTPCSNAPGGYKTGAIDEHGRLSPGANRAIGHKNIRQDGFIQSHHPIQDEWARRNIWGYNSKTAPGTLLPSSSESAHAQISAAQRARRATPNGWNTTLREEFNIGYSEMQRAGVPRAQINKAYKDAYKYFDNIRDSNIGNPFFNI